MPAQQKPGITLFFWIGLVLLTNPAFCAAGEGKAGTTTAGDESKEICLSDGEVGWRATPDQTPECQPAKIAFQQDEKEKIDGHPCLAAEVTGKPDGLGFAFVRKLDLDELLSHFTTLHFSYKIVSAYRGEGDSSGLWRGIGVRINLMMKDVRYLLSMKDDGDWHEMDVPLDKVEKEYQNVSRDQVPREVWIGFYFAKQFDVTAKIGGVKLVK